MVNDTIAPIPSLSTSNIASGGTIALMAAPAGEIGSTVASAQREAVAPGTQNGVGAGQSNSNNQEPNQASFGGRMRTLYLRMLAGGSK